MLATATSERPGAHRWTELVIYRLRDDSYVLSKIGRTTVAHRPECGRVTRWMVTWLEAKGEARVHRHPCIECMPAVGDEMDPHTVLESTRYSALWVNDADELIAALLRGRPDQAEQHPRRLSTIVGTVVDQLLTVDQPFSVSWNRVLGNNR